MSVSTIDGGSAVSSTASVTGEQTVTLLPGPGDIDPVGYQRRRRIIDVVLRIGTPIALLVAWQVTASAGVLDPRFFPAPSRIAETFVELIRSDLLVTELQVSIRRILVGFVAGALVGIFVGFALGLVRPLRVAFDPIISAFYTVPKLAILPLLLLIFGLGETPIILLIALGVFFIMAITTTAVVSQVPSGYREPAVTFGASPLQSFRHVLLPAVLPELFTGLRIAAGNAVLLTIGIEFVQGGRGVGYMIWNSWQLFLADRMYVGIVSVAVLGALFQGFIAFIGTRLSPWASEASRR